MPGLLVWVLGTEISGCCSSAVWTLTTEQGVTVAQAVLPQPPKFWDPRSAPLAFLEHFPVPTMSEALFMPGGG